MSAALQIDELDLIEPDRFVSGGYPHDAWRLLRQQDPVHWVERDPIPFWAITKHEDITLIGKSPDKFLNGPTLFIPTEPERRETFEMPPTLIQMDPPVHGAFRKIVSKRFTPGALRRIHGDIVEIAGEIIDDLLASGDEGEVDFVEKVAAPLPIAVIAWLLGVPREKWRDIFDWTNQTIGSGDPEYQRPGETAEETGRRAMTELFTYFAQLVEEKRQKPSDDLISAFIEAEVEGRKLELMEILSYCLIIVVAGNETTRNGTSGGMLALIEHQDELRKVQRDPTLLPSAIEEILRWTSPIIHFARTATEDFPLRDKLIRKDDRVALFYPSANRDEDIFPDPYTFRVDRRPNRHLAFGIGEHFCAGAHVARLELEIAFKTLIPRIQEIELAGPIERLRSNLVGGVKHLPIRYKLRPA